MSRKRLKISRKVQVQLEIDNRMTCCICEDHTKGVIIHHIDGNPSNNKPRNLALICQDCHDKVHKKGGQTRNLNPDYIKRKKELWENKVKTMYKMKEYEPKTINKVQELLLESEIRRAVYVIVSTPKDDIDIIQHQFNYLGIIQFYEGCTETILKYLGMVATPIGISDPKKTIMLAETLSKLFVDLIAVRKDRTKKADKENLSYAIDMLIGLMDTASEYLRNEYVVESIVKAIKNLWTIVEVKKLKSVQNKSLKRLTEIRDSLDDENTESESLISCREAIHELILELDEKE